MVKQSPKQIEILVVFEQGVLKHLAPVIIYDLILFIAALPQTRRHI
ncbi:MAG: hypothetical protein H8F28_08365 [Fibrella sp.]|nr:hypothetical protein [Armatimonadota bacterium]